MHSPAATVIPASRTANLLINGFTFWVSKASFPIGLILTLALSPFFKKSGLDFITSPVVGLICSINSTNWHGTCAVWTWKTGVYPFAKTLGWLITVIVAINSYAIGTGYVASQITSPLAMSFLPTPLIFIPTLSPATASE